MAEEDYREVIDRLERIENSVKYLDARITQQEMATPIWDFFVRIFIIGLIGYAIWWFLFD
mgnify:CR=1 FL=1